MDRRFGVIMVATAVSGAVGCGDGVAPAAALVTGEYGITDIAVDDNFVYFSTQGGALKKVSIDGGPIETLASDVRGAKRIAIDATDVYCVTETGTVVRVAKRGGELLQLAEGSEIDAGGIVVDDAGVYVTVQGTNGLGAVRRMAKAGGAEIAELASNQTNPGALALSLGHLYWAVDDALIEMPVEGGDPHAFMPDQSKPISVASDSSYVYWANFGDGFRSRRGGREQPDRRRGGRREPVPGGRRFGERLLDEHRRDALDGPGRRRGGARGALVRAARAHSSRAR